jgi:hypothetical protein
VRSVKHKKNVKFSTSLQDSLALFFTDLQTNSPISVTTLHVRKNVGVRLVSRPNSKEHLSPGSEQSGTIVHLITFCLNFAVLSRATNEKPHKCLSEPQVKQLMSQALPVVQRVGLGAQHDQVRRPPSRSGAS